MIFVFGATGTVGSQVVAQLAARGAPARVGTRDPRKAAAAAKPGIDVVAIELDDSDSLDAALRGVTRAFLVTGGDTTLREANFLHAAQRASVRHVVRLSGSFLVGPDSTVLFDQWHHQAEQALQGSGMAYTHLRPSFFMQNLPRMLAGDTIALPFARAAVNLVDARDIAAVAVAALTGAGHEGHTYEITGPQALTFDEVAGTLGAALGRPVTYRPIGRDDFVAALRSGGLPEQMASALADEYSIIGSGHPAFTTVRDTVERVTGAPAHTLAQFAADFAADFPPPHGPGPAPAEASR